MATSAAHTTGVTTEAEPAPPATLQGAASLRPLPAVRLPRSPTMPRPNRPAYLGNQIPVSEMNPNSLAFVKAVFGRNAHRDSRNRSHHRQLADHRSHPPDRVQLHRPHRPAYRHEGLHLLPLLRHSVVRRPPQHAAHALHLDSDSLPAVRRELDARLQPDHHHAGAVRPDPC